MNCIRPAAAGDLPRIAEIEVFNYRLNFYPIFRSDAYYFTELTVPKLMQARASCLASILVYDDGAVKGFLLHDGPQVVKLFVEPVLQGRGIGAALLDYAVRELHVTWLWALEKNTRAIAFYARHGFVPTGEKVLEEDTDEYLIRLEKPLDVLLTTDRLTIRPVQEADWPAVQEIWARLAPLPMAQYDKPHNTASDHVRARVARWADFTRKGTEHMFFAVCLEGTMIGYFAFNAREAGHEIGYSFHPAYHGRGYAGEALSAILAYLQRLGFTRFFAGTALNNTPSVRLLEHLGFQLTGTEKVSFYKDAAGRDIVFDGGIFERQQ